MSEAKTEHNNEMVFETLKGISRSLTKTIKLIQAIKNLKLFSNGGLITRGISNLLLIKKCAKSLSPNFSL